MVLTHSVKAILCAIWCILWGLGAFGVLSVPGIFMGILAIIIGVLLLVGK